MMKRLRAYKVQEEKAHEQCHLDAEIRKKEAGR